MSCMDAGACCLVATLGLVVVFAAGFNELHHLIEQIHVALPLSLVPYACVRFGRLLCIVATIRRRLVGDILPEKRGQESLKRA